MLASLSTFLFTVFRSLFSPPLIPRHVPVSRRQTDRSSGSSRHKDKETERERGKDAGAAHSTCRIHVLLSKVGGRQSTSQLQKLWSCGKRPHDCVGVPDDETFSLRPPGWPWNAMTCGDNILLSCTTLSALSSNLSYVLITSLGIPARCIEPHLLTCIPWPQISSQCTSSHRIASCCTVFYCAGLLFRCRPSSSATPACTPSCGSSTSAPSSNQQSPRSWRSSSLPRPPGAAPAPPAAAATQAAATPSPPAHSRRHCQHILSSRTSPQQAVFWRCCKPAAVRMAD